ncbi:MAG TPA: M48 family metalloprotease [Kofleriaceae bacterium]
MTARWFVVCWLAACAQQSYLGAEAPDACKATPDTQNCAAWLTARELDAAQLDVYDDPTLRDYVQSIADRLAAGSHLSQPPHVTISDHDGTYAPFGDRVVIGRITLERLGTEAEVAAVVAHEMVHVEGHHTTMSLFGPDADERWLETRRDAEGVADERAVALLEHAGYAPAAMPRALAAELDTDDDEHPPREDRIARVAALANHRTTGFEGRRELLAHEDHMIVGRDTRLGQLIGNAWVIASLGVAMRLHHEDVVHIEGDTLELHHERATLTLYPIGEPWAKELAGRLVDRHEFDTSLGIITVGVAGEDPSNDADPLARLERVVRATLPQPPAGTWVVVLDRCTDSGACAGLVIELAVSGDTITRNRWLSSLRAATEGELAAAEPTRIVLIDAPRTAKLKDLVGLCPDPDAALALDNGERPIVAGSAIKCTDRRTHARAIADVERPVQHVAVQITGER